MKTEKDNWINSVMDSLEGIQKADPGSLWKEELLAKASGIQRIKKSPFARVGFISAAASLAILAAFNIFSWVQMSKYGKANEANMFDQAADEYQVSSDVYSSNISLEAL